MRVWGRTMQNAYPNFNVAPLCYALDHHSSVWLRDFASLLELKRDDMGSP